VHKLPPAYLLVVAIVVALGTVAVLGRKLGAW